MKAFAAIAVLLLPSVAIAQEAIDNDNTRAFAKWLASPEVTIQVEGYNETIRAGIATVTLGDKTGVLLEIELTQEEISRAREGKLTIELEPDKVTHAIARTREGKGYEAVEAANMPSVLADPSRTTVCGHRKLLTNMTGGGTTTRMVGIGAITLPLPTPIPGLQFSCILGAPFNCPTATCLFPIPRLPVAGAATSELWGQSGVDFAGPSSNFIAGRCVSQVFRHLPRWPIPLTFCGCD